MGRPRPLRPLRPLVGVISVTALVLLASFAGPASAKSKKEFSKLVSCLSTSFPTLTSLLVKQNLTSPISELLSKGPLTVMAPSEEAFGKFKPKPSCKFSLTNVLLDHVIIGKVPVGTFLSLPIGTKVPTYGPDKLTKLKTSPPKIGITRGHKTLSSAQIIKTGVCNSMNYVVHRIDTVLLKCS